MTAQGSSRYRPDIDGLRTIAVVPVVLFHAGIPTVSGGFVGVDVFFVISGFLITGIIAREMRADRFSLLEFYRRRARRIFPALTVVGFATMAAGYGVLTPKEFLNLGESAASITLFASNFYFWKSVSYFNPGVQPLLHTWSLAVEEQYYVFFPLLLMVLHGRKSWIAPVLWLIFILSLALSILLVAMKPSAAFYLLPSRAWELMLGGLLALGQFQAPTRETHGKVASAVGLALILIPMFTYTHSTPFPGAAALPPAIGAAMVIWGGGWGLSSRPMVVVGLLSYSLYLWHLPVIEFAKYLTDAPLSIPAALCASIVSLGLASLTYRFIETPFRVGRARQRLAITAAAGMASLAVIAVCVVYLNGMPSRLDRKQGRQIAVMDDESRHPSQCMTLDTRWVDPAKACRFGEDPAVLLWGDSHSMVTATSMIAAGVEFIYAADADCPIGKGLSIDANYERGLVEQGHYRRCGDYNRLMLARALEPDLKTIVLSSRWTNWRIGEPGNPAEGVVDIRLADADGTAKSALDNRRKFERAFTALVEDLTHAGKQVVIVGPIPEPTFNVPHRLYVSGFGLALAPEPVTDFQERHRVILKFLLQFEGRPGVSFIWPATSLCRGATCDTVRNGLPLFFDHNHLTVAAAKSLAPMYRDLR